MLQLERAFDQFRHGLISGGRTWRKFFAEFFVGADGRAVVSDADTLTATGETISFSGLDTLLAIDDFGGAPATSPVAAAAGAGPGIEQPAAAP